MLWLILFVISFSVNIGLLIGTLWAVVDIKKNVTIKSMDFRSPRERLLETDRFIAQAKNEEK